MSRTLLIFLAAVASFSAPASSWAFPETVRHGYNNCTSCHVSPTGGGLLTQYGRALSAELLSRGKFFFESSSEDSKAPAAEEESPEPKFLNGTVSLPVGFELGGDIRFLQAIRDTNSATDGRFIPMQMDLEASYKYSRVRALGTFGRAEPRLKSPGLSDYLISRRHWLSLALGMGESVEDVQLRVGRFSPAYGLNIADHIAVTRQGLGFDQGRETYNAELSWIGERLNLYVTAILGRPDQAPDKRERGGSLQGWWNFGNSVKLGANVYTGLVPFEPSTKRRSLVGVNAIVGWTPSVYSLLELDGTHTKANGWGAAQLLKTGWEFTRGWHWTITQEFSKTSFASGPKLFESYTMGVTYYPRPHWEFSASLAAQRDTSGSREFSRLAALLAHYYF